MADMNMNETADPGVIRAEFEKLREELASIRKLLASEASEHFAGVKEAAEGRFAALQAEVEKLAADAKGQSKEVLHEIDRKVQEHPLTSLAVAFGVGLLAAQILRK
ncbi:MAG TPA: hypothetical protein VG848_13490 [Acetobacteraceae bacterium]|jgi:ElaB/YqjD/DUF883 family membrane-anchored ribosome-binding protein|nr:hypothetical protein [Acetobacteraceae bacterium]